MEHNNSYSIKLDTLIQFVKCFHELTQYHNSFSQFFYPQNRIMYPSFIILPYLYVAWYAFHLLLPLFQWNVYFSQWLSSIIWPWQTCFTSEFTCLPQPSYSGRSLRNVKISQREYIVGFHDDINYNPCHVWEKCVRREFFFSLNWSK